MNRMVETLEDRRLMSAVSVESFAANTGGVETTGLLLPAVQKVRENPQSSASATGGGPVVKAFSGGDNAAGRHTGGVNVCLADGSVHF